MAGLLGDHAKLIQMVESLCPNSAPERYTIQDISFRYLQLTQHLTGNNGRPRKGSPCHHKTQPPPKHSSPSSPSSSPSNSTSSSSTEPEAPRQKITKNISSSEEELLLKEPSPGSSKARTPKRKLQPLCKTKRTKRWQKESKDGKVKNAATQTNIAIKPHERWPGGDPANNQVPFCHYCKKTRPQH